MTTTRREPGRSRGASSADAQGLSARTGSGRPAGRAGGRATGTRTTAPRRGTGRADTLQVDTEALFAERSRGHRRRMWRRAGWGVLAAAVLAGVVWAVWWQPLLSVRSVEVDGVDGAEARAVARLVEVPLGTPLARVDPDAVADRVRTRITVAEASVTRSWPSTLVVHAVPRTPALVLKNPNGELEVVDVSGVSYKTVSSRPHGIPLVTATTAQGTSRESLRAALALVATLPPDLAKRVSEVEVSTANLVTFRIGSVTVVWGGGEQGDRKVAILRALLRTRPKVIDVSAPDTPVTR